MSYRSAPDLSCRNGFVEAIKAAGEYIAEHADNLLGEYPALLSDMRITATFEFDSVPCVEVTRAHIVCKPEEYPNGKGGDHQ
ncbi:hypothetical protein [Eggerthella guodeyinii]|uniref:Uncharacterized protein n=1 Tax=Eggerthella guodeyinii TaxID=2690837 RepID=A0A6N7RLT5_9ACTN|nr:hypothetical protein [Eggerthella guodeyinii]MRX82229.1 hypothetical protein [Eggerthella guodeyinii]